ncbi:carbohydrate ABC transporter substrate-binding protein [Treponema parvum]|uniref:Carbohydrate ABC transporter substrate-binding protein n=1 Tax=Treponema parvum TaxID=138851 RepID=A0A975IEF8_9SPIR|nr:ABC transporter substrate-binding protein [Treponema parvum]QTQ14010.1 carbohydrate ABC transporter substrate-binding protein [Treponema parvum]
MKKVLKIAAGLCLVAALLVTGCKKAENKKSGASKEAKLTMFWWGNQTRNERTQKILSMFEAENPGVKFDPQFAEWADYWSKLAASSAGKQMPDVIQMDYQYITQYVSKNLLVDLKPYINDKVLDVSNINKGILASGSVDGKVYAICNGVNAPSLFYNKTLLDANGITVKDNMTMEEFMQLSAEIYKKTGYKTNPSYGGNIFLTYFMRGEGVELFGDKKFNATVENLKAFFDIYERGTKEGWMISPTVFAERTLGSVEQSSLIYGSSGSNMSWCYFGWSNQLSAFTKAAPEGMKLGITTWPAKDPVKANYLKPSQFFCVSVDSKEPKIAAQLINYITNSVDCNNVLLGERGIPASSVVADAIAPKFDETQQMVIKYINTVVSPNCSAISPADPQGAPQVFKTMTTYVDKICFGILTAEKAAAEFFDEGNKILAR